METLVRHVAFVICLPLFFLVFAPFLYSVAFVLLLIKKLLTLLKKGLILNYGDFLNGMDGLLGCESPYENPEIICVLTYLLNGSVTVAQVRDKMATVVQKHYDEGYPQLKQYLSTWLGFAIWKPVTDFRIEDYVKILEPEVIDRLVGETAITDENGSQLFHNLGKVPFQKGRAPWELLVCPAITSKHAPEGNSSMIIFRYHHTVADGAIAEKIMSKLFNTEEHVHNVMNLLEKGSVVKDEGWNGVRNTLVSIYELVRVLVYRSDFNALHMPWTLRRSNYSYQSIALPLEKIKCVRKAQNVSFSAVVCGIQTLALRRLFVDRKASIPSAIHAVVSVPMDVSNPRALNNISSIVLKYPTGESDGRKICQIIDRDFRDQKAAKYSDIIYKLASFVALMPQKLKFLYPGWLFSTVAGTNFPTGTHVKKFGSHSVVHYSGRAQIPSNFAMWFWSLGYGDSLYLTIGISEDIMPDRSFMKPFMMYLENELDKLAGAEDSMLKTKAD